MEKAGAVLFYPFKTEKVTLIGRNGTYLGLGNAGIKLLVIQIMLKTRKSGLEADFHIYLSLT